MGAVEDTRKVIQDFLAPELREIKARLDALEKRFEESGKHVDQRFNQVDQRFEQVNQRFAEAAKHVDERFEQAEKRADERQQHLMLSLNNIANYNEMRDRLVRLELEGIRSKEAKESAHQ